MEAFTCLLKKAEEEGYLPGWRIKGRGGEGARINHLLFAYDTLVFCDAKQEYVALSSNLD